jgi:hypothetical protein
MYAEFSYDLVPGSHANDEVLEKILENMPKASMRFPLVITRMARTAACSSSRCIAGECEPLGGWGPFFRGGFWLFPRDEVELPTSAAGHAAPPAPPARP